MTLCGKTNVLTFAFDLWERAFYDVAKEFPDIETDYAHVDAICMWMVKNPEWFDVLVTGNLTIKESTREVSFSMTFSDEDGKRVVRGEFTIDRREFSIGLESQQNDDFVGYPVVVKFRFDIAAPSN